MIGFFPTPHPDELFYSICARYGKRTGYPNKRGIIKDLFGGTGFSAAVDFPNRLEYMLSLFPPNNYTSDEFIGKNTLLPFHEPFLSKERSAQIRAEMKYGKENRLRMRLGLNIPQVKTPEYIRFCPLCVTDDRQRYGETYWHRCHQPAGVLVCVKHKCFLQNSIISLERESSYNFRYAEECLIVQPPQFLNEVDSEHDLLLYLAESAEWLLSRENLCLPEGQLRERYYNLLLERGYAYYNGRIRNTKLFNDFIGYFTQPVLERLGCMPFSAEKGWLAKLLEKNRSNIIHHPLRNLLLLRFLETTAKDFFTDFTEYKPFGDGPYPCLNRASEHYGEMTISNCQVMDNTVKKQREKPLGIFVCECGYTYQRVGPDSSRKDRFTYSSIKEYGKTWETKLEELWSDLTLSVGGIARTLKVSNLLVVRHAMRLNLPMNTPDSRTVQGYERHRHPYKIVSESLSKHRSNLLSTLETFPEITRQQLLEKANTSYLWLRRNDSDWMDDNLPAAVDGKRKGDILDWVKIDEDLSQEVDNICREVLDARPVLRVSITEIIKRTEKQTWLEKRGTKLPKTAAVVNKYLESLEDYMLRKIQIMEKDFLSRKISIPRSEFIYQLNLRNETSRTSPRIQNAITDALERINTQD